MLSVFKILLSLKLVSGLVYLGEIVYKDGDIFGDSVNIANRIEKISKPSGICISGLIFDQLENKKGYEFKQRRDSIHLKEWGALSIYMD